jgi:outer membrane receptor protein involved in Fe transport
MRFLRIAFLALAALLTCSGIVPALAQNAAVPATGAVDGFIADLTNGLPVSAATVVLFQDTKEVSTGKSDARGRFHFDAVAPGLYTVLITAAGYQDSRSREFTVQANEETTVNLAVNRATESQQTALKTIGSVTVSSAGALASTTTITRTIDPQQLLKENYLRAGDALLRLPGVNASGLSSSVSDDLSLDIRGLGPSETQALVDGHPVGPQGVYAINGGGSYPTSFNYADSPLFGLSRIQVTFGSGAAGLYGVDAIGGTVDMQTLAPTLRPVFQFSQGLGDQGRAQSAITATGTSGRLAYAFAGGVQGTYGMFAPKLIAQTGRPNNNGNANNNGDCTQGNDISACNLALNTYSVSQNSTLRSGLAKLRYDLSNNTSFTTTVFASGQQSDSTGNGDNDNIPYDTRLAQIKSNPGNCSLPTDPSSVQSGYQVITVSHSNTPNACYTAAQWAAASYGPYGGGADRNRGTMMSDYDFRLQSTYGKNLITADGFYNYYKFYKSSEEAAGLDPSGTEFAGTAYSQFLNTQGYLVSDDIQNEKSDIGFGFFSEYQLGSRLDYNVVGQGLFNYETPESTHYNSGFMRASYDFNRAFSIYGNFWVKSDSIFGDTNFDPRVSLVFRPSGPDVVRLTFGHSTGDPAAELKATGPPSINANPSSLNPSCTPFNQIGTGGNPGIRPESANDYEIGYAHKFDTGSSVQLNLYYTNVQNQLFSANEPITEFGAVTIPPALLQGFATKIGSICPAVNPADPASVIPFLAIGTTYNAASAVSKGAEVVGRQYVARHVYFDYTYNLQSVVGNGINIDILKNNPFIVNGGQLLGIPVNQATVGLDYANRGLEARMDGYIVGPNNPSSRPAYNVWNGFVTQALPKGLSVTVGVQNVFNEAWQRYGYFGHAPLFAENQFYNDRTPIQQYLSTGSNEEFGLPIRSFVVTLTSRI